LYAYVAFYGGTASVIDLDLNTVIANITVAQNEIYDSESMAVTPNGNYVYVANSDNQSVSVISTATDTVISTIPVGVGERPTAVAITPNGEYAYVTCADAVFVISTFTNSVTATIPLEGDGLAITPDGKYAYIGLIDGIVAVVSTINNTVTQRISLGNSVTAHCVAIAPNGKYVYVGISDSSQDTMVAVISTSTNNLTATTTVVDELSLKSLGGNSGISSIAVTPNNEYVYVATL